MQQDGLRRIDGPAIDARGTWVLAKLLVARKLRLGVRGHRTVQTFYCIMLVSFAM